MASTASLLQARITLALKVQVPSNHMNHSLNSLKGLYRGLYMGSTIGDIKGDARSLDYGSYAYPKPVL